jgi:hypothetical protein
VILIRPVVTVLEIELPRVVGTGDHAVTTADTAMMIYDDNTIVAFVSRLNRTNLSTRRIVAVIAQQDHISFGRIRAGDIPGFDFANPVYVPSVITMESNVVLGATGLQTGSTAILTFGEVDDHTPSATGQGVPEWVAAQTGGDQKPDCEGT